MVKEDVEVVTVEDVVVVVNVRLVVLVDVKLKVVLVVVYVLIVEVVAVFVSSSRTPQQIGLTVAYSQCTSLIPSIPFKRLESVLSSVLSSNKFVRASAAISLLSA